MTIWTPDLSDYTGPRYRALADAICDAINRGDLPPDTKLPPQRRLADALGVTVGTVTRAYGVVEQRGKVVARVGSGTYVAGAKQKESYWSLDRDKKIDLATSRAPMQPQLPLISQALHQLADDHQGLARLIDYSSEKIDRIHHSFTSYLQGLSLVFDPRLLLLTHGGQHGVFSFLTAACRPGDVIAIDELSYPGVKLAAHSLGLKVVGLKMDDQGMLPEELSSLCRQQQPRLVYLTPNNHNPTCVVMSPERRQAIVDICCQHDLWIIEDDVNYCQPEQRLDPMYNLAPERVCYLTSLSKCFAGGLRIGMMVPPESLNIDTQQAIYATSGMSGPLLFEAAAGWIDQGDMARVQQWLCEETKQRQAMADRLLDGIGVEQRGRGLNRWILLPDFVPAREFANRAAQAGVTLRIGDDYALGHAVAANGVRLSLGGPRTPDCLERGLSELAAIYRQMSQQFVGVL